MKLKIVIALLFIVCAGLGVALVLKQKQAQEEQKKAEDQAFTISNLSNDVKQKSAKLEETHQVNVALEEDLKKREAKLGDLSNNVTQLATKLEKAEADAKAQEQAAQAELAKRDTRIKELESTRDDMANHMTTLTNMIGDLQKQINETERKLAVSEGDRDFLLKELKRLQGDKAELERQFNDLKVLKAQIAKIKDEMTIARRLEWNRTGVGTGLKGAELLVRKTPTPPTPGGTNFNLNVEVKQDGGARVLPGTNAPAPK